MSTILKVTVQGPTSKEVILDVDFLSNIINSFPVIADDIPKGSGTEFSPYILETIGNWAWAAKTSTAKKIEIQLSNGDKKFYATGDIYLIAGHIIQRNPDGGFKDYVTDLADAGQVLGTPANGTDDFGRPRLFPRADRSLPVYSAKYQRMEDEILTGDTLIRKKGVFDETEIIHKEVDNATLARMFRDTLKAKQSQFTVVSEVPGSLASMFLSEVCRQPKMLLIGLMLLDLIEAGGNINGKPCTFKSAMHYTAAEAAQGAMHPMFHQNSVKESKEIGWNNVWKKSIDILAAWLAYVLTKNATLTPVSTELSAKKSNAGFQQNKKHEEGAKGDIKSKLLTILTQRASNLEHM